MPFTITTVTPAALRRAQGRAQRFADDIRQALPPSLRGREGARQTAQDGDSKSAFLDNSKHGEAALEPRLRKPLPTPKHVSSRHVSSTRVSSGRASSTRANSERASSRQPATIEPARSPEQLANLAARRALRDEMVEAYGEKLAGEAFAHLGVALKGEGKFAPLDETMRQGLRRYACSLHTLNAAYRQLVELTPGGERGLKSSEEYGLLMEVLRREVTNHPNLGVARLRPMEVFDLVVDVIKLSEIMQIKLRNEVRFEEFLRPQLGRYFGMSLTFDQHLVDYQEEYPQYARASDADTARLRQEFRAYCNPSLGQHEVEAIDFIASKYPNFSRDKLAMIETQRDQIYLSLLPMMPKELARVISVMVWVMSQREVFPAPVASRSPQVSVHVPF